MKTNKGIILVTFLLGLAFFPFVAYSTGLGGAINIATVETLSSSPTYSALPTPDSLSVTLNQTSAVTIMYNSAVVKLGCIGTMLSVLDINNVQIPGSEKHVGLQLNSSGANDIIYTTQPLAPGKYTFNVLHRVDGCTGYWRNRSLTVLIHT